MPHASSKPSPHTTQHPPISIWMRSAAWDLTFLAFCWVPFYIWLRWFLQLGGTDPWTQQTTSNFLLALAFTLGVTFVHRHYTFVIVYGESHRWKANPLRYLLLPVVLILGIGLARWVHHSILTTAPSKRVLWSPWMVILLVSGTWNIWHTIRQRYGILRMYAGKLGHGLELPAHGKRDHRLLWSNVLLTMCLLLLFRWQTLTQHPNSRRILNSLLPVLHNDWFRAGLVVIALGCVGYTLHWLRWELRYSLPWKQRLARWSLLVSTWILFALFIYHGPVLGYLCFGFTHAVEYLAFVHRYWQQKAIKQEKTNLFGQLVRSSLLSAFLFVLIFGGMYWVSIPWKRTDLFLVYYFTTSLLHFLFDGWIWKLRRPDVAASLAIPVATESASAAN
jgi:hypothetical protein